jgi:hypothetical protein
MREANGVIRVTKDLTTADLDHLIDPNANTIGALMLHLAATETYYQLNTFEGKKWDTWPDSVKQQWDAAMNLAGCGKIKSGACFAICFFIFREVGGSDFRCFGVAKSNF